MAHCFNNRISKLSNLFLRDQPDIFVQPCKESVVEILSAIECTKNHKDVTYFICYLFLVVRALVGPVIEWVHVFVDTKNYLRLINCEGNRNNGCKI